MNKQYEISLGDENNFFDENLSNEKNSQQNHRELILEIALPVPLRCYFDYLAPISLAEADKKELVPGILLKVPFGYQEHIGVLIRTKKTSELSADKLRRAINILDNTPALTQELLDLCIWAADYYQCPLGEALHAALPAKLRQGNSTTATTEKEFVLTVEGKGLPVGALKRAKQQMALLAILQQQDKITESELKTLQIPPSAAKKLIEKGLVALVEKKPKPTENHASDIAELSDKNIYREQPLSLNEEQAYALDQIDYKKFSSYLLDGTTGSGKTEIYLQAIAKVLKLGKQALVLVPEIGLTPQTISRFQRRFAQPIVALHSGLNDRERMDVWLQARAGTARIIIGTRSAIFTPLKNPGIIIIDEEHDLSFKQQDGFRYSARDLAIVRAQRLSIPLLLGSATPSLETLHNAQQGRYQHLHLRTRAGNAKAASLRLLDIRGEILQEGFAQTSIDAIHETLRKGNQVMVFINRRGFAPTLECQDCGWLAKCLYCDARMTVHKTPSYLHCHHCDHQRRMLRQCPKCQSSRLIPLGQGTERSETALSALFPNEKIIRVDRDSTRNKNGLEKLLIDVHSGQPCILVGTQMLAKGHHFPDVTLVVILDADAGLFSPDFRGVERMGQMITQVAGRAGRAEKNGEVIIQTLHGDHPWIQTLVSNGYHALAKTILHERQYTHLPPFSYLALLKAESTQAKTAKDFLKELRAQAEKHHPASSQLNYLGPMPAIMEKRSDRFRYQLLIKSLQRKPLQKLLQQLAFDMETKGVGTKLRWAIDVDPLDMG
jgi:primosomal protein N' (replication factor Y) (superfamily II helicase)